VIASADSFTPPIADLAPRLVAWQREHGRHGLPWQASQGQGGKRPSAYHVWLSEVMLQQTQVTTVIGYFARFLERFPTVESLAIAPQDDVLALWSGLGYYSRARNLHAAAKMVMEKFAGEFPASTELLIELPGVGRSTAAAIAALAYGKQAAILDGNVKRVLSRLYAVDAQSKLANEKALWAYAEKLAPVKDIESYTQGLMDMGATLCTRVRPSCGVCPFEHDCVAHQRGEETLYPLKKKTKAAEKKSADGKAGSTKRRSKKAVMLMLYFEDQLLLERRPASGIWGGLWSAAEYDSVDEAMHAARLAGLVKQQHIGIETKHSFTHYDLYATPLRVNLSELHAQCNEDTQRWVSAEQALQMGIPTLLRKWLIT
jgi:A/G-specific adenine glycosylase